MRRFYIVCIIFLGSWLGFSSDAVAGEERLIAVIMAGSQPRYQDIHTVFVESLQGFCGENCRTYVQTPNADTLSLRNSVRKAVALGADLIVTYGPAATLAAKAESPSIPTLFADVYDPVGLKLVSPKTLTGRNMTGVRGDAPVQALFKYFTDATNAHKLAVLYDANSPEANLQKKILEKRGKKKGVAIVLLPVVDSKDHVTPLKALPADADGIFLASSEHTTSHLSHVMEFASYRKLPVLTQRAGAAAIGAFMVLETSAAEQGEKLAEMAEQVFAGKNLEEMPMSKPHQVAFVINLKVAKKYGIQVPFQTLSVASRIIH